MSTSESTLSKIFCAAGPLIASRIEIIGQTPRKKFINHWLHKNGLVSYNGVDWSYESTTHLNNYQKRLIEDGFVSLSTKSMMIPESSTQYDDWKEPETSQ